MSRKVAPNILAAARITRELDGFPRETRRSILEFVLRCEEEADAREQERTDPQMTIPS